MKYEIINLAEWKRGDLFRFYINQMRIVMSMTVDVNVTPLTTFVRENGLKFYPCMMWVVSKVINRHDEFKCSWSENGELIRWESVSPSYTDFHAEDESFTKAVIEYSDDLATFHARYLNAREINKNCRGLVPSQAKNCFDVSCMPWVRYRHFDVHVFDDGKFLAPVVTWGKYEEECKGTIMPLTMNIHHAVADGFHLSRFFAEVQEEINKLKGGYI